MAVAPRHLAHIIGPLSAPQSLEIYFDYVCPFSAKMFKTVYQEVLPWLAESYEGKVKFIFRHQVQPWHAVSTVAHESALAVERVAPDKFFPYSEAIFSSQAQFFDEAVENKTRRQIIEDLAKLAQNRVNIPPDAMADLISNGTGEPKNAGNKVTDDLKFHIRLGRQNGIHVSPTVLWNGVRDDSVSSSWTLSEWKHYLESKVY